ncbi:DNA polymerase III [Chitinophaga sp. 212800010-3]|uniref:DNA polymerase III n=1 Tax=unclassified Chitinophaga TaxID=2619133 RepID=UPI002DE31B26|nr:hypothetical protein [Chitinophaga sp. 212800010-3]
MKTHENTTAKIPVGLAALLDIRGITPSVVNALHQELNINDLATLTRAINSGRLKEVKSLTDEQIEDIKHALKLHKTAGSRISLWDATLIGTEIVKAIEQFPETEKVSFAGSLRRKDDTIGDIDMVVQVSNNNKKKLISKINALPQVSHVVAVGNSRICLLLQNHLQADIRLTNKEQYGATMLHYTGPVAHNDQLMKLAEKNGYHLGEAGLSNSDNGTYIGGTTEEEIYRLLHLSYPEPELRGNAEVVASAAAHQLPALISFNQIRGDMQIHSNYCDGAAGIIEIARYVIHAFPHYQYMVITDHSIPGKDKAQMNYLDYLRQFEEIDNINKILGLNFVKKGVEAIIQENMELNQPRELLQQADWVIATIQDGLNRDNTQRLISACENPFVNCIAHPGGRIISLQNGYPVDWDAVFRKAAATGTALEINSRPDRLDLSADLARQAIKHGVKLAIDADAYTLPHFDFIHLGIATARKAGCSKSDILNAQPWDVISKIRRNKIDTITGKQK